MQKEELDHEFSGVLVGLTTCSHGTTHVAIDVNVSKIHMTPAHAELIIDMIYNQLVAIGYYVGDENDGEEEDVEVHRVSH